MFKPWHIATSSYRLAVNLNKCKCQHASGFKHDHARGSETPKTAFYPETMSRTISECLFPEAVLFAMPVITKSSVVSHPAPHQCNSNVGSHEVQHQQILAMMNALTSESKHTPNEPDPHSVYAGIHMLLDRKDWHKHPGWEEAIAKEAGGILENGTWNYDEVISREDLLKRKSPVHNIGRLMTILSVKHWGAPELRRLKARIVFQG